jgi:two-component system OmpR family response regulator
MHAEAVSQEPAAAAPARRSRVLLVEDSARLAASIRDYLERHAFEVFIEADGRAVAERFERLKPDLVILDLMLPGKDGLTLCRELRRGDRVPILILTAKGENIDQVLGLEMGADDYVPKPFSPRELLARLRAVLRRTQPDEPPARLQAGGVAVDLGTREAWVDGAAIELTGLEFDILTALVRKAGRVIPRTSLLAEAGRADVSVSERTVDVHISKLRKKLGDDPATPRRIRTVRGVGYLLAREHE